MGKKSVFAKTGLVLVVTSQPGIPGRRYITEVLLKIVVKPNQPTYHAMTLNTAKKS